MLKALAPERWLADWAGGVLWLARHGDGDEVFSAARAVGGYAVRVCAPLETRARGVFPPEEPERAALAQAVKAAFDPGAVLNRGRMYEGL